VTSKITQFDPPNLSKGVARSLFAFLIFFLIIFFVFFCK